MRIRRSLGRSFRSVLSAFGVVGIAGLATGIPGTAHAQLTGSGGGTGTSGYGISLTTTAVPRFTQTGQTYNFRAANLNPNDINFADCESDIILQFNVTETTGGTSDPLEIWAGTTDCTQPTARAGGESPFCWQVYPQQVYQQVATFNIQARSLTRFVDTTLDSVPNGGNPIVGPQPESACHTQTSSGQVAMNIYFMFLPQGGDTSPDASTSYSLNVDMVGPLAPTNLTAAIGDKLLLINWTPQIDPTIQGFMIYAEDQGPNGLGLFAEAGTAVQTTPIYCKGSGGTTVCPDAATAADGSIEAAANDAACTTVYPDGAAYTQILDSSDYTSLSDASLAEMGCSRGFPTNGVTTSSLNGGTCTSSILVDKFSSTVTASTSSIGVDGGFIDSGTFVSTVDGSAGVSGVVGISEIDGGVFGVGNVGGNTTSSYTIQNLPDGGPLINGHQYAIAVAAYDDDGNVGLLSNLACQTPEPVIDFWDRYTADGGNGGGGFFCSLQGPGVPVAGSMFGLGLGAALVAYTRRRRRRNS